MTHNITRKLKAQLPPHAQLFGLALQFTQPLGFWMRVHPACSAQTILPGTLARAQDKAQLLAQVRAAAKGGAL